MANTRELRRRIKSIKSTAKITKAMQMVAASKMRKAQNQALNGRPYSLNLNISLSRLLSLVQLGSHPLLSGKETALRNGKTMAGVIIISTDKSLCGALNTNLFRMILSSSELMSNENVFYTVGKKGRNFVARIGKNLQADFENLDIVTFRQATQLSRMIIDSFLKGDIDKAYLIYPHFVSILRQEPKSIKLLPIELESVNDEGGEFLFEPSVSSLLEYILVHHVQIQIYQALLEAKASEYSAKMLAMQNATDNALELVDDLNLTYNQTRQGAITRELLEITTATVAME